MRSKSMTLRFDIKPTKGNNTGKRTVVGVDVGSPPSVDVIPGLEVVPIHAIRQHPYHPSTSDDDKNTDNGSSCSPKSECNLIGPCS